MKNPANGKTLNITDTKSDKKTFYLGGGLLKEIGE